jgi:hypothetical protein
MAYKKLKSTTRTTVYATRSFQLTDNLSITYNYTDGEFVSADFKFHPKLLKSISKNIRPFYAPATFKTEVLDKNLNPFSDASEWAIDKQEGIPEDVNDIDVSRIYLSYGYAHLMFSLDEKIIPLVHHCDYMTGNFENKSYRLEELLPYLKEHPMVIKDYSAYKTRRGDEYLKIQSVPHYNNDDGKRMHIAFKVLPELESYNELFLKAFGPKGGDGFGTKLREMVLGQYGCMGHGVDYLGLEPYRKKKYTQAYLNANPSAA